MAVDRGAALNGSAFNGSAFNGSAFNGVLWHWRGPSPFHFISLPPDLSDEISARAPSLSYGWGAIPVSVRIGSTEFTTAIFPKDGEYILPIRASVRTAERLAVGDVAHVHLQVREP